MISRDKTAVGIEIEKVLNDALPLLQAVDPADLNATLNTLATALEGRGSEIAETLTQLDGYLKKLNPSVPNLIAALTKLTQVSQLYGDVTPDLVRALRNLTITGNTVVEKEQQLQTFFTDVQTLSTTGDTFLKQNEDRVIRLGEVKPADPGPAGAVLPGVPLLPQGDDRHRADPERHVPRRRPAHQPRADHEPAHAVPAERARRRTRTSAGPPASARTTATRARSRVPTRSRTPRRTSPVTTA